VPPGTTRYWSWLFAAEPCRAPLLGVYALGAEWQALMDPAAESSAARLKLAWWHEEMQRLAAHSPVHPISRYLAALPGAAAVDFSPLLGAVNAAAVQISGVPLERGADLEPQSQALWGAPLLLAAQLAAAAQAQAQTPAQVPAEEDAAARSLRDCSGALAAGEYLAKALREYRREARIGRIPFAIDELMAAGIDNADLAAEPPPAPLRNYLDGLRGRAAAYFDQCALSLPRAQRAGQRHLLVLAALGRRHLTHPAPPERRRLQDMLLAWRTARRAQKENRSSI
jgi:phytoene synthase